MLNLPFLEFPDLLNLATTATTTAATAATNATTTTQPWLDSWRLGLENWTDHLGRTSTGLLKVVLAALCGGLVGLEREIRGHSAGFRTFMLVAAGAALTMVVSQSLAYIEWPFDPRRPSYIQIDPGRIAYGVMTGVGFLGAGTIMQQRGQVKGLTTAAGIWVVAAIGLACGSGLYVTSAIATLLLILALTALAFVGGKVPEWQVRRVQVIIPNTPGALDEVEKILEEDCGLGVKQLRVRRRDDGRLMIDASVLFVRKSKWNESRRKLLADDRILVKRLG